MSIFRYLDENLKDKWKGVNDDVPVNSSMYVFVTKEEEEKFVKNMYPTDQDMIKYNKYKQTYRK